MGRGIILIWMAIIFWMIVFITCEGIYGILTFTGYVAELFLGWARPAWEFRRGLVETKL